MKTFGDWKDTIRKELARIGYDFEIFFELKENVEEFKNKMQFQTKKILEDKITTAN